MIITQEQYNTVVKGLAEQLIILRAFQDEQRTALIARDTFINELREHHEKQSKRIAELIQNADKDFQSLQVAKDTATYIKQIKRCNKAELDKMLDTIIKVCS